MKNEKLIIKTKIFGFEYRGYGIQNDQLELRINKKFSVLKKMLCSLRYEQNTDMKLNINQKYLNLRCVFFKSKKKIVSPKLELAVFDTINPIFGNKKFHGFIMYFSFFIERFFKEKF